MPIISTIGRRSFKIRALVFTIFALLSVGAVSMVYPYLVTVTSAMTDELDYEQFNPYPKYWFDKGQRYLKFLAEKYALAARFDHFKAAYHAPAQRSSRHVTIRFPMRGGYLPAHR